MNDHIEKQIELKAPLSRVWRALTYSGEFAKWFGITFAGPFVPGQTKVSYAGRVYDDEELRLGVESILQFWLTAGPFGNQVECLRGCCRIGRKAKQKARPNQPYHVICRDVLPGSSISMILISDSNASIRKPCAKIMI